MDYVWCIAYEHSSSEVNSQLSVQMETYGGSDYPQNHFIFDFQIHYVHFPWEVYIPANALLELILKGVCIPWAHTNWE